MCVCVCVRNDLFLWYTSLPSASSCHVKFSRTELFLFFCWWMQHLLYVCDGFTSLSLFMVFVSISLQYLPLTMSRSTAIISLVNFSYTPQCRWQKSKYSTGEMFLSIVYVCVCVCVRSGGKKCGRYVIVLWFKEDYIPNSIEDAWSEHSAAVLNWIELLKWIHFGEIKTVEMKTKAIEF